MRLEAHTVIVQNFHFAVQTIATQIHEVTTPFLYPPFDLVIHVGAPIFGVDLADDDLIGLQVYLIVVKLMLAVEVIVVTFALQPSQEPPLGRGQVAGLATGNRVGRFGLFWHMVEGFWSLPGDGRVLLIQGTPFGIAAAEAVARQVLATVDGGCVG
jgi:hypothetical protein